MSHHERTEARVIPLRAPTPLASVQGSLALDLKILVMTLVVLVRASE